MFLYPISGVASPKKWGVRKICLCRWAVIVTIYIIIHTCDTPIYTYKKTLQGICANLRRGLNISGGSRPTHSLVATPLYPIVTQPREVGCPHHGPGEQTVKYSFHMLPFTLSPAPDQMESVWLLKLILKETIHFSGCSRGDQGLGVCSRIGSFHFFVCLFCCVPNQPTTDSSHSRHHIHCYADETLSQRHNSKVLTV